MKRLSVVMPVYNRADFLEATIDAYQQQSYGNWELIIVDDCSTDETLDIANRVAETDTRIRVFHQEHNQGVGRARARAIKEASGEIIVIGDSDDRPYANRLEVIAQCFDQHPEIDVYYSNVDIRYAGTDRIERRPFQPFNKELLYFINYIPNPAAAFRRACYLDVGGYDTTLRLSEDYDLWLSFSDNDMVFYSHPDSLVEMTIHSGSVRAGHEEEMKMAINTVRQRHGGRAPSLDDVRQLATPEIFEFFTEEARQKRWFQT